MPTLTRRTAAAGALAALAALIVSSTPSQAHAAGPERLTNADLTLLVGLHQAALWEIPAAHLAAQQGTTPKIRQAGQKLADDHGRLDRQTIDAATTLKATIPATATTQQQDTLKQLQTADRSQFDQLFVADLRDAYGFLYPIVGEVRSATRSTVIRNLADQANISLLDYLQTLENTGLVPYQKLAPAAIPPAQDLSAMGMARADAGISPPTSPALLWLLTIGASLLAAITALRIRRSRRPTSDPRTAPPGNPGR